MNTKQPIETTYTLPCPVSVALLTDFHNSDPAPVLASLQRRSPEIITIAGDFILGDLPKRRRLKIKENRRAVELLRGCAALAPSFVSLGNHEYMLSEADLKVVRSTGVTLLDNSWVSHRGMIIGGQSSAYCHMYRDYRQQHKGKGLYPDIAIYDLKKRQVPRLDWLDEFEQQTGFRLLLCHHPEYYPLYLRERKLDLIFSGHCHGGQWRFYSPFHRETRGVYAPGQGFFPALTSGVHDGKLVISRGLSNTVWIPRINNPTEIIYIHNGAHGDSSAGAAKPAQQDSTP